jgi:hypothetical protein
MTMAPREERLIPRDITKSTRRNISFVKMIKQSPTRLVQNGGRSSRKMYRSRSLINALDGTKIVGRRWNSGKIRLETQKPSSTHPACHRRKGKETSYTEHFHAAIY